MFDNGNFVLDKRYIQGKKGCFHLEAPKTPQKKNKLLVGGTITADLEMVGYKE
jgi:hypothetical protein